jgi:hypothetical protein
MNTAATVLNVAYGDMPGAAGGFQRSSMHALPFGDVVTRLEAGIEAADLWVLDEIDPQMLLRKGGYAIGKARQILFFHPKYVARILSTNPAALIEAPLKFVILELAPAQVSLRWFDPVCSFDRYNHPALTSLGSELSGVCLDIVTAAFAGWSDGRRARAG